MKAGLQRAGAFLSAMVVPNIAAFIAWGFITALFIPTGWIPNAHLAKLVGPMSLALLPLLIGYSGGRLVYGIRGGVLGALATMGVVAGSTVPMFVGAMVVGPLAAWTIKRFDRWAADRVPVGFEMLVSNFSAGIIGMAFTLVVYAAVGPALARVTAAIAQGAESITRAGLLPFIALFIEPGKVLFINNAINHGVLSPLGLAQAKEMGRSIFFLLETNPGPGLGLLLAYALSGRGMARQSAPGAMVIHFLGGIHEIYFPYALMNPATLLALIAGGLAADLTFVATGAGLVAVPSPGSIFAEIAMAPRGGLAPVLLGIAAGAVVSCVVAMPIVRWWSAGESDAGQLEEAAEQVRAMKAAARGTAPARADAETRKVSSAARSIVFVCEAGMGSSVMGQSVLKRKLAQARLEIEVTHAAVSDIPPAAQVIVCHRSLAARVQQAAPRAAVYEVDDFLTSPAYDGLIADLSAARGR